MKRPARKEQVAYLEKKLKEQVDLIDRELHYARLFIEQKKYPEAKEAVETALHLIGHADAFNQNKKTAA